MLSELAERRVLGSSALGSAVVVLISLPAGVWVDRLRRKPIMIAADLGRAIMVASIPIAACSSTASTSRFAE